MFIYQQWTSSNISTRSDSVNSKDTQQWTSPDTNTNSDSDLCMDTCSPSSAVPDVLSVGPEVVSVNTATINKLGMYYDFSRILQLVNLLNW